MRICRFIVDNDTYIVYHYGMTSQTPTAKERAARSRLRQILNQSGLLRANLVLMKRPCGGTACRCARGKRYWHASWYISQSRDGKIRMKIIPRDQLETVRAWAMDYHEARKLLGVIGDERWDRIGKAKKRR